MYFCVLYVHGFRAVVGLADFSRHVLCYEHPWAVQIRDIIASECEYRLNCYISNHCSLRTTLQLYLCMNIWC